MINILKKEAIRHFVNSDKKLFDAIYMSHRDQIKCKIYKNNKDGIIYLYLLNDIFDGSQPYEDFMPKKYGFRYSYFLAGISNYIVTGKDFRSPAVYLIINNKINNIKIKIK